MKVKTNSATKAKETTNKGGSEISAPISRAKDELNKQAAKILEIIHEKDPEFAEYLEEGYVYNYVPWNLHVLDDLCKERRNSVYASLSPVRATDLFIETYVAEITLDEDGRAEKYGVGCGMTSAKADVILDLWQARQAADLLGMKYGNYIFSVIKDYQENTRTKDGPRPAYMKSAEAVAAADNYLAEHDPPTLVM